MFHSYGKFSGQVSYFAVARQSRDERSAVSRNSNRSPLFVTNHFLGADQIASGSVDQPHSAFDERRS
jgi:hypothetical protein